MAPSIINNSNDEDSKDNSKTYYLRLEVDNNVFYKIGVCKGSVAKRYSKEPVETLIKILKIWHHPTESKAFNHEAKLFKDFPGNRPFVGKCGPLKYGGNTETYSHDVVGDEPPPHTHVARIYSISEGCIYTTGYSEINPRDAYSHLHGQVRYMDYAFGPKQFNEGLYLQIPQLSHEKSVVLATEDYLKSILSNSLVTQGGLSKKKAADALERFIVIDSWTDYSKMEFEGKHFKIPKWTSLM